MNQYTTLFKTCYFISSRVATHIGNFQVKENLRETQGILIYFLNSGKLRKFLIFSTKIRKVLRFKESQ